MALFDINLPEVSEEKTALDCSRFVIEPLHPGYGMTLGNSMRRVLLSSLAGAAVTAVKISGVSHEFTVVEGVREDVIEIILNLKRLRLKYYGDEPGTIVLTKKGKGVVTAADIKANSEVEVVNKDLEIANIDDAKTTFEMEIRVEQGRGYVPVESRGSETLPVGWIAVDALYTPIERVRYSVENTRVGQMTNLDKLIIDIETDGSIEPKEALEQSAQILVGHFQVLSGQDALSVGTEGIITADSSDASDLDSTLIDEVNFSPRTTNALLNNGFKTIGEIAALSRAELKDLKGFGQKAFDEVVEKLEELGVQTEK